MDGMSGDWDFIGTKNISPQAPGGGAMPDMSKMNVAWLKILTVHLKRNGVG